jgi:nitronate monooxygenase
MYLRSSNVASMKFAGPQAAKAWRDICGAGQRGGAIDVVVPVADLLKRLEREYEEAQEQVSA